MLFYHVNPENKFPRKLTSSTLSVISARSKLTLERFAPAKLDPAKFAYLKFTNLRSSLERSAPAKFRPWNEEQKAWG